jgi:hypothetical protein
VTWSLLAVEVGTLNTHGVCTISLQAAVHPLTGPHTNKQNVCITNSPYKPDILSRNYDRDSISVLTKIKNSLNILEND